MYVVVVGKEAMLGPTCGRKEDYVEYRCEGEVGLCCKLAVGEDGDCGGRYI